MSNSRAGILKEIVTSPKTAFSEIGQNGKKYFPIAFIILFGTAVSSPLISFMMEASNHYYYVEEQLSIDFTAIFFEIEFVFFFGIGFAALVYSIGKKFGGQGSFKGVFSSLCYSSLPVAIVGVLVLLPFGVLGGDLLNDSETLFSLFFISLIVIGIASSIWGIILSILAVKESHQIGIGKTIGVLILAGIVLLVIALPVVLLGEIISGRTNFFF